jgi:heme exporter protein B
LAKVPRNAPPISGLPRQIVALLRKEARQDYRRQYAVNGILLYVATTVFIVYRLLPTVDNETWVALFWVVISFASANAAAKSFINQNPAERRYLYTVVSPAAVLIARMLYNVLLLTVLGLVTWLAFSLLLRNPVLGYGQWVSALLLGGLSYGSSFTMVSAIAAQARNAATMMAVLGFPVILPQLLLLLRYSQKALAALPWSELARDGIGLLAINVIVISVALLLFPMLWRA